MPERTEREVIEAFVAHLAKNGYPGLKVDQWPDQVERKLPAPDAVAGNFVIEHTSMDTMPNQRSVAATFRHLVAPLELEFESKVPYRLSISLPHGGVARLKGKRLEEVQDSLRSWIEGNLPTLKDGLHPIEVEGLPFRMHAMKRSGGSPGLRFGMGIGETVAEVNDLQNRLKGKVAKLVEFPRESKTTVLLIESEDLALMNEKLATEMIGTAFGWTLPPGLDRIWFADTSIREELLFYNLTDRIRTPFTEKLLLEFHGLCNHAYDAWVTHRTLFDDNTRVAELDKHGMAPFFSRLFTITQAYALLQIRKLHDPGFQKRRRRPDLRTLSLDYVVRFGPWDDAIKAALKKMKHELDDFAENLTGARNQVLAHNDVSAILRGDPLGAFPADADEAYFETLKKFIDTAYDALVGGPLPFHGMAKGDVFMFLKRVLDGNELT